MHITVTIKNRTYIVKPGHRKGDYGTYTVLSDYVTYEGMRDGKPFGPIRDAKSDAKPGSVGAQIWAAAEASGLTKHLRG